MNIELIKPILTFLGGALAFLGSVLTFVNSRLKDAESIAARERIVSATLQWSSAAFNLAGIVFAVLLDGYMATAFSFSIAFILQIVIFVRRPFPIQRFELVTFVVLCCFFTLFAAGVVTLHFTGRLLDILDIMVKPR